MKNPKQIHKLIPVYMLLLSCFVLLAFVGSNAITTLSENAPIEDRSCIIIDAGHGGVDGGATSCTGILESEMNLEIALRLNDLLHLLGYRTCMIRTTDISVYTEGNSIAAKKVSDLKERVRIVNSTENAILISIHQNTFSDSKYSGAQVFYAATDRSKEFATEVQSVFKSTINPTSKRMAKKADGIYLMQHINCTGILVECGFISNLTEEYQLNHPEYQQQICGVLATCISNFLDRRNLN